MKPVLVTTKHRGVFFGYLDGEPNGPGKLVLERARNCISWDATCKGVFGLAAAGPNDRCRIGPQVSSITLYGITSVTPVTDEAAANWERAPWKS